MQSEESKPAEMVKPTAPTTDEPKLTGEQTKPVGEGVIHHPEATEGPRRLNILVAVDDDEESEKAVLWALNHFAGPCFGFSVLHAYDFSTVIAGAPVTGVPYAYGALHQAVREEAEHKARAVLHKFNLLFKTKQRTLATCVAHRGSPKDVILSYVEKHPTDLLIVGSRGLTGLSKWMTSVSYFCLHNVPCSTLVVKTCSELSESGPRTVTICMDRSPLGEKACQWARDNFLQPGDEVNLVSVCQPPEAAKSEEEHAKSLLSTQAYLTHFADEMGAKNKCRVMVPTGDAREVIVGLVAKDVDLLVMGSRGLGLFKRTLLGSVVDHCAAQTCVPILVVK